jgi:hypothetical protein
MVRTIHFYIRPVTNNDTEKFEVAPIALRLNEAYTAISPTALHRILSRLSDPAHRHSSNYHISLLMLLVQQKQSGRAHI